jgi:hypothetical protein
MSYSRTSLANRACDLVGKDTFLDLDTDTTTWGKIVKRNFEPIFKYCLRKSPWPVPMVRMSLNPSATAPENEFSYAFDLPGNFIKLVRIFPDGIKYKREGDQIITDESAITIKYISSAVIDDPAKIDPDFAEYFAHSLAVAISYKATDSVALRNELKKEADRLFQEAAALFSQEDTDDDIEESPWVTARSASYDYGTIKLEGLE